MTLEELKEIGLWVKENRPLEKQFIERYPFIEIKSFTDTDTKYELEVNLGGKLSWLSVWFTASGVFLSMKFFTC